MASVFSEDLRIYNAEQFKESVSETDSSSLYMTIGRAYPWANDASPLQANSSVAVFNDVWQNMIAAKQITGNDIKHVIRRVDWSANTVYDAYDHCICSLILYSENTEFYILTTDWNVYKCLANNNGSNSTVMPTQLVTDGAVQESDGYIWKYMYTISDSDRLRYTTSEYMPVKTLTQDDGSLQWDVQQDAIQGGIEAVKVTNSGSNYIDANTITLTVTGDGVDCSLTPSVNTTSNTIESVVVTNPGSGYTFAEISVTDSSGGTGAEFRAMISPTGGHGSDPLRELGGSFLLLNPRFSGSEGSKIPVGNDYRQLSIIQDPFVDQTSNVASNTIYSQYTTLTLNGVSVDYVEDENVYQGDSLAEATFSGKVLQWDSANSLIRLTNTRGTPTTELLTGANSAASRFVDSITEGELEKYTGKLLYVDHVTPIERSDDQTEDYKIVFQF